MSSLVALHAGEEIEFVYLRKLLNLTDGNLGAHLAKLEEAGYVKVKKTFVARKPRTFITVTGKGRDAFDRAYQCFETDYRRPTENQFERKIK